MAAANSTHTENKWIPLAEFCDRIGVPLRRGRWYVTCGKVKIRKKKLKNERVFVDWFDWNKG